MIEPVRTQGLSKRYGDLLAVDDLELTVRPSEVYGFLGPNGAGKTTTLRMLLGLIRPTSGSVRLLGEPVGRTALSKVGALIEGPAFYPYLSGRDNLRVLAGHAGADRSRVRAVLDQVDLTDRAGDKYANYSMGMRQRLGLAAALLKDPELLILDEPTNGLDPAGMADMRTVIRKLAGDGRTVLLSSHLLGEVQQVCDRVGVINRGRLVAESTVSDLADGGSLRVEARPAERAFSLVSSLVGADNVRRDGPAIDVTVERHEAGRINTALVRGDVEVSELHWRQPDLEQTFFELTGAPSDDR